MAVGSADNAKEVQLKICRDGKVQKVAIQLAHDHGLGTRRLVHWCGAQFQVSMFIILPNLCTSRASLSRQDARKWDACS